MKDFKPGDKIEVLVSPDSQEDSDWVSAEIEEVLSSQITIKWNGASGFLFKSDFNAIWRMAGEKV